jgi:hypothetical protein
MKKSKECDCSDCSCCSKGNVKNWGSGCMLYGLGFIGAAIYNIQQATGFWSGTWGVIKAIVWPAFVVHKLLGF